MVQSFVTEIDYTSLDLVDSSLEKSSNNSPVKEFWWDAVIGDGARQKIAQDFRRVRRIEDQVR